MKRHIINIAIIFASTFAVGGATYYFTADNRVGEQVTSDGDLDEETKAESKGAVKPKFEIVTSGGVFLVDTEGSKKYHRTSKCRYLKRSKAEVLQVSIESAEASGRTPCKSCYKSN